jgi:hypothetical protein
MAFDVNDSIEPEELFVLIPVGEPSPIEER